MLRWVAVAALAALVAGAGGALAQNPVSMRLDYEAYIGGFRIVSMATRVRWDAVSYDIEYAALTRGVVGWIGDWKGRGAARGAVAGDALRPTKNRDDSSWRGDPRLIDLTYGRDGSVIADVRPSPEQDGRDPVPPQLTRNTIDGLSMMVAITRDVGSTGRCDGTWPVFDGRRRFDLALSEGGDGALDKTDYGMFAGKAHKCLASVRRIAGFWKDQRAAAPDETKPIAIWLAAPKPGLPAVPVRLEAEFALGTLVVHLKAAE